MNKNLLLLLSLQVSLTYTMYYRYPINPGDAIAAVKERQLERLQYINAQCPTSLSETDTCGRTALHIAVLTQQVAAITYLIKLPATRNLLEMQDCAGRTPLHCAAANGYSSIMQILAEAGACTTTLDYENKTAADLLDQHKKLFRFTNTLEHVKDVTLTSPKEKTDPE